ncbi:ABC transporter ATP-binding protein [Aureimonas fodinaquatilis]|nr:ATP-binding cassette domain-containing protein [Aureimonas fodinaquatilis]
MLEARNVSAVYGSRIIFDHVSLRLSLGTVYCVSGPSGCGKTTLGRILAGLNRPAGGEILYDQESVSDTKKWPVQYLYQSPLTAMNPRWQIKKIVEEAGSVDAGLARMLGVETEWETRYPHELSGGQLQRVSILRSLGASPAFLIADEITAALDPVAQAQIWQLLLELTERCKLGIVAISHDESLISRIAQPGNHFSLSDQN